MVSGLDNYLFAFFPLQLLSLLVFLSTSMANNNSQDSCTGPTTFALVPISWLTLVLMAQQQQFMTLSQALNHTLLIDLDHTNLLLSHAQMENVIL